jgi:hypothetical protein
MLGVADPTLTFMNVIRSWFPAFSSGWVGRPFEISGRLLGCGELADYLNRERPACCGLIARFWWRGLGRAVREGNFSGGSSSL